LKQIAVVGGSGRISPEVERMAEEVGRGIARRGAVLISGGKGGVMEASCRGAKEAGGLTIGILPEERGEANRYVDVAVVTGMGYARNVINVYSADAIISIGGEAGTLSEIALALKAGKRVVALKPSGGVSAMMAGRTVGGLTVLSAETVEEALSLAFE